MRHPNEILSVLDQAQKQLDPNQFDLRSLLWEVIEDVRNSYRLAMNGTFGDLIEFESPMVNEVETTVGDYLCNHYGDD